VVKLSLEITNFQEAQIFYEELRAQGRKPFFKIIQGHRYIFWDSERVKV